jgi:hypothetical protein
MYSITHIQLNWQAIPLQPKGVNLDLTQDRIVSENVTGCGFSKHLIFQRPVRALGCQAAWAEHERSTTISP